MTRLADLAKVIRSKNAGPFEITLDVIFPDKSSYERVRDSDVLTAERIAELYKLPREDVLISMFFEPALAYKATLRRGWPQGSIAERDTFGAQQHAPLLTIEI